MATPAEASERAPSAPSAPTPSPRRPRQIVVSRGAAVLYAFLLLGLLLILWSSRRERESHVRVPDLVALGSALPSIAGLTGSPILEGNRIEVLQNGDGLFPPLLADMAAAEESIHLESYVWWQGEINRRLAESLAAKARQGVEVRLTLDAVGSNKGDEELFESLEAAGVRIAFFHPFRLEDLGLFNNRTHRKLAIVDGRVGYVFGHGIARQWMGDGEDEEHWRDTGVRLEGPVVNALQAVFAENWVEQTAEVLVGEKYFPRLPAVGGVRAHVASSSPQGGVSRLEILVKLAIATAQQELLIQNPYFIPDEEMSVLLQRAAERGVRVRVMVPGVVTDSSVVRHASHRRYGELLRHGIEIWEHQRTLVHQKVLVVDGLWSHVGSTNLDDRSLDINDEVSVGIIDRGIAAELRAAFEDDLRHCRRVTLEEHRQRSLAHRLLDRMSYLVNEQI